MAIDQRRIDERRNGFIPCLKVCSFYIWGEVISYLLYPSSAREVGALRVLAERLQHGDHAQDRGPDEVPRRAGRHRLRHALLLRRRHLGVHADNAGTELINRFHLLGQIVIT